MNDDFINSRFKYAFVTFIAGYDNKSSTLEKKILL